MEERFRRHALIPDWKQERLAAATVAIAGVGALGNWVAQTLALAGIGRLILCDNDTVSESNLSRTPLFHPGDVGRLKVGAAADRLRDLAPGVVVDARPDVFEAAVGLVELRDDIALTIGCLDSRAARLELAGRCALVRAPSIDGATHPWGGEVRPFLDPDGTCFSCGLSQTQRGESDLPWSCLDVREDAPVGSAAPASALIGSWCALLAVRTLCGAPVPPDILAIDAAFGTFRRVATERDPSCPLHRAVDRTIPVALDDSATVAALRQAVPGGAEPLLWRAAETDALCRNCGWEEHGSRLARPRPCPRCGELLLLDTSLEVSRVDQAATLRQLGVPAREILAARTPAGRIWLELTGAGKRRDGG
jgi:molybdopterin/thiamine biosynthesis adenylyltransferase